MKKFTDTKNRDWTVSVTVGSVKRVKGSVAYEDGGKLVPLDLMRVLDGRLLERLAEDAELLCDTLYALCEPEAKTRNIDAMDFAEGLGGDVLDEASRALLAEIVDFFPGARRTVLRRLAAKTEQVRMKANAILEGRAEAIIESPELEQQLLTALGVSSTDSPESLESTPTAAP